MTTSALSVHAPFAQEVASRLRRHLPQIRLILDGIALLFAIATFYQVGDPDLLLHCVFLILTLQAFMGGLRPTLLRIMAGTIVVFGYSSFAGGGSLRPVELAPLELTEWPLMVAIVVLVAVAADRVNAVSARYARLYRTASDSLLTAQEDERRRMALELHDGVGQTLTALTMTLDAADSLMWAGPDAPPIHARDALRRAQELAASALDETRDLSFQLRPARIAETGLAASLAELSRSAGGIVEARIDPDLRRRGFLEPIGEVEVYRIAQEALGNALRHGHAQHIQITLAQEPGVLRLEVADDGVGMDPATTRSQGLGLPGMQERASMLGGALSIDSAAGKGTRVRLAVPLASDVLATQGSGGEPMAEPMSA